MSTKELTSDSLLCHTFYTVQIQAWEQVHIHKQLHSKSTI